MTREQKTDESNFGSMEHRVCHKIRVFYTVEIFHLASLSILNLVKIPLLKNWLVLDTVSHFRTDFNSGGKFTNFEAAGRYQKRFREHKKLFWGAPRK